MQSENFTDDPLSFTSKLIPCFTPQENIFDPQVEDDDDDDGQGAFRSQAFGSQNGGKRKRDKEIREKTKNPKKVKGAKKGEEPLPKQTRSMTKNHGN